MVQIPAPQLTASVGLGKIFHRASSPLVTLIGCQTNWKQTAEMYCLNLPRLAARDQGVGSAQLPRKEGQGLL